MAELEAIFVDAKRTHSFHASNEQAVALKCAKLEATLVRRASHRRARTPHALLVSARAKRHQRSRPPFLCLHGRRTRTMRW